ncbi:Rib/alpha-like domain-containing protein, partial [Corynebacterium sp. Marseille-P8863]|uniref:Rib/alpha-like domain-containing protein n=1 Tax=Corynebacterium sp. Marseille-P8863 TaxID=2866576 RepID=UPI00226528DF
MRSIFTPRKVDLRPALAASMAATLAISGTAAVSIAAPPAAYAQAEDEAPAVPERDDTAIPEVDGAPVGLEGTGTGYAWYQSYVPTYPDFVLGKVGQKVEVPAPEYWEFYPSELQRPEPSGVTYELVQNGDDLSWVDFHDDGSMTLDLTNGIPNDAQQARLGVKAILDGTTFTTYVHVYLADSEEDLPAHIRYEPKFPRHPQVIKPGDQPFILEEVAWSDPFREKSSDKWPLHMGKPGSQAILTVDRNTLDNEPAFKKTRDFFSQPGNNVSVTDNKLKIEVADGAERAGLLEIPLDVDYDKSNGQYDLPNFHIFVGEPHQSTQYLPEKVSEITVGVNASGSTPTPLLIDTHKARGESYEQPEGARFFVSDVGNNRDWVRIENGEIVARPNDIALKGVHHVPVQVEFSDGSVSPAFDVTVTVTTMDDLYDPQGQAQNVKYGEDPEPKNSVADTDALPDGTEFDFT